MPKRRASVQDIPQIPDEEFRITHARASGAGGQNVNKRDTKAFVRWRAEESSAFTHEQKRRIRSALDRRISKDGFLFASADRERSQSQNREAAKALVRALVAQALVPAAPRISTRPTKASTQRRLREKTLRSGIKASRRLRQQDLRDD